ncbi:putative DNA-binding protein with PD1-like motif [Skermanella aerolata]|uniref:PCC domain-containing protein n=1 Tax=Skermanella aerolata TaxID=393310 RepID=UPI003D1ABB06
MMIDPDRRVLQPGPAPSERVQWVAGNARLLEFTLEPRLNFIEAIRRPLAEAGGESAVLTLVGGAFGPFTYVVPAPAPTPEHAAYYSEFHRPAGISRLEDAAVTFGRRDGIAFLHCHGVWTGADGIRRGGHVIPDQTVIAEPVRARAWVLDGMAFEAQPDPETNFTLFGPVSGASASSGRFFAARFRPNQDICGALEDFCRSRGIVSAALRGGVASTIGAVFENGSVVDSFATEMFIRSGSISSGTDGALEAALDVALVDHRGNLAEGLLTRGANPILMTLEVVIEALAGSA